jgi:hypothetical protein
MMEVRPAPPPVGEVVLVRWPEEVLRLDRLRAVGVRGRGYLLQSVDAARAG